MIINCLCIGGIYNNMHYLVYSRCANIYKQKFTTILKLSYGNRLLVYSYNRIFPKDKLFIWQLK